MHVIGVSESEGANLPERGGKRDGGAEPDAAEECLVSDLADTLGDHDRAVEPVIIREGGGADLPQRRRDVDLPEALHDGERRLSYPHHVVGEDYPRYTEAEVLIRGLILTEGPVGHCIVLDPGVPEVKDPEVAFGGASPQRLEVGLVDRSGDCQLRGGVGVVLTQDPVELAQLPG